ncbi:MAG: DUF547 domain-containing protein [Pseudomonadota bacterium]
MEPLESRAMEGAPGARSWDHFTSHNPASGREIDHSAWSLWLRRHVAPGSDGLMLVAYTKIKRSDRYLLDSYIHDLEGTKISRYKRIEQLAFWINLYNALSIQQVAGLMPIESLREMSNGIGVPAKGPWREKLVTIEGQGVSLFDIEHRILRPIWRDPRVLYALNRAAVGAPGLMAKAYTAHNLNRLLNQVAAAYVNSRHGLLVSEGRLTVSSLYTWYKPDFGGDDQAVIAHLKNFAEPELHDQLASVSEISDEHYDWRLNDQAMIAERAEAADILEPEMLPGDKGR